MAKSEHGSVERRFDRRRGTRTVAVLSSTAFLAMLGFQFERMAAGRDPVLKTVSSAPARTQQTTTTTTTTSDPSQTGSGGGSAYTPAQSDMPRTGSS